MDSLPDYSESTWKMLSEAFPDGATDEEYLAVIEVLLQRLSFHNISTVLRALLPGRDGHYNDVSAVAGGAALISAAARAAVAQRLAKHGLREWLTETD